MSLRLGIDCGGTDTKLLLAESIDGRATVVRRAHFPTPRHPEALDEIGSSVRRFLNGDLPESFGIAVPGIVDGDGVALASTNLAWLRRLAPAEALEGVLGVSGRAVNDGAAAARAEAILGAARGERDAFVLTLGTGIGGAQVVDGEIRHGAHGGAGEIGHVSLGGDRLCSCGQRGCLETEIGGRQLLQRWRGLISEPADQSLSVHDLVLAARAGDPAARGLLDGATTALARSILGLIALVDPGIIVIGGGLAQAEDQIMAPTVEKVKSMATFHAIPSIIPAALGVWGASWGAVLASPDGGASSALASLALGGLHLGVSGP